MSAFTCEQLVHEGQEFVFHVFLQLGDDLHPAAKQQLEDFLGLDFGHFR